MPQPARALAGAACALVLSTTMFTPAAFADDAEGDDATTSRHLRRCRFYTRRA